MEEIKCVIKSWCLDLFHPFFQGGRIQFLSPVSIKLNKTLILSQPIYTNEQNDTNFQCDIC